VKVTEVRIYPTQGKGKIIAYCSVTLDDVLVIRDCKIVQGEKEKFFAFPSRKEGDKYIDIVFTLSRELRQSIGESVISAYNQQGAPSEKEKEWSSQRKDEDLPF